MGPIFTLDDFIDMTRRHLRLIMSLTAVGCVFSVLFALSQPHVYQSTEVIQIARPMIANDLARSTVAGSSARRLQLIEQRLLARGSMLEIIDAFNLYSEFPALKPGELVALLRKSIRIEGVAAAREGSSDDGTISVLSISAAMPHAIQARQVASEIANRTINLSVNSRIEQARETLAFFDTQSRQLTSEVTTLDAEIAAFRIDNDLTLPGSIEFRRDEISTLNEALLDIDREMILINRESDLAQRSERKATAKRMLADFNEQLTTLAAQRKLLQDRKSELERSLDTSPEIERQLGAYERHLAQLHDELDVIATHRAEAEVGFRLETERQGERLTVIEPAALPDYPVKGGRKRIAIMGGALSVMLSFVAAFLLELRNPVIRTARQMEREIGFAPVVSIPFLDASPPKTSRWQKLRFWDGGAPQASHGTVG